MNARKSFAAAAVDPYLSGAHPTMQQGGRQIEPALQKLEEFLAAFSFAHDGTVSGGNAGRGVRGRSRGFVRWHTAYFDPKVLLASSVGVGTAMPEAAFGKNE